MILADSIRQTASMVRWISVAVTDTHHTSSIRRASPCAQRLYARAALYPRTSCFGSEVFRSQHLANFGFALHPGQCFLCSSMKCFADSSASFFDWNSRIANRRRLLWLVKGPSIGVIWP